MLFLSGLWTFFVFALLGKLLIRFEVLEWLRSTPIWFAGDAWWRHASLDELRATSAVALKVWYLFSAILGILSVVLSTQ